MSCNSSYQSVRKVKASKVKKQFEKKSLNYRVNLKSEQFELSNPVSSIPISFLEAKNPNIVSLVADDTLENYLADSNIHFNDTKDSILDERQQNKLELNEYGLYGFILTSLGYLATWVGYKEDILAEYFLVLLVNLMILAFVLSLWGRKKRIEYPQKYSRFGNILADLSLILNAMWQFGLFLICLAVLVLVAVIIIIAR